MFDIFDGKAIIFAIEFRIIPMINGGKAMIVWPTSVAFTKKAVIAWFSLEVPPPITFWFVGEAPNNCFGNGGSCVTILISGLKSLDGEERKSTLGLESPAPPPPSPRRR